MTTLLGTSRGSVTIEFPDRSIIHAGICDFSITMGSSGNFSLSIKVLVKDGHGIDRVPSDYANLVRKIRT